MNLPTKGDKLILIHVLRDAVAAEEVQSCKRKEELIEGVKPSSEYHVNTWYAINNSGTAPILLEIFTGLPEDEPTVSRQGTSCAMFGTKLFDIGGTGSTDATYELIFSQVRCLDTANLKAGWKTSTLPFCCSDVLIAAESSCELMYLLPTADSLIIAQPRCMYQRDSYPHPTQPNRWSVSEHITAAERKAYMYDPIKQGGIYFPAPSGLPLHSWHSATVVNPRGCGLIAPMDEKDGCQYIYKLDHDDGFFWEVTRGPFKKIGSGPRSMCGKMLYVYNEALHELDVFDMQLCAFSGTIHLPQFDPPFGYKTPSFVAVGEHKVCLLWLKCSVFDDLPRLHYVKITVSVSFDRYERIEQSSFLMSANELLNVLALQEDTSQGEGVKDMSIEEENEYGIEALKRKMDSLGNFPSPKKACLGKEH